MDTLWLMCGIAVVAVGLLMMFGGSKGRSLDDVYARRALAREARAVGTAPANGTPEPVTEPALGTTTVVLATPTPEAGRHRVPT